MNDNKLNAKNTKIETSEFGPIYRQFEGKVKEAFEFLIAHEDGDLLAMFQIGNKIVTVRKNLRDKGKKIADKNWVLTAYDEKAADGGSAITTSN